ncbi:MAG TPA: prepilin-type N-terminal cleavage/methylation domain-containing protein [Patescibacteria group bacterium]|nr:prepilin-type N-terminal cleavage/methylation domain-containing protein [Patescibacteria group bacterium]
MNKKGFTLIELLIVIAIIGLLATLAILSLTAAQKKARDAKRVSDVKTMQMAMEMYYNDNSHYPNIGDGTVGGNPDGVTVDNINTWTLLQTEMKPYTNSLPVAPNHDNAEVYTYYANCTASTINTTQYYLSTTLENDNGVLDSDVDGPSLSVPSWMKLTSAGSVPLSKLAADATMSCEDSTYIFCLSQGAN